MRQQTKTHIMMRLDHRGHGPIARWSPDDVVSREKARRVFDQHVAEHYTLYDVTKPSPMSDAPGHKLESFDPEADEILAVPRMKGG